MRPALHMPLAEMTMAGPLNSLMAWDSAVLNV